ncbi:MAG: hypothetical protein PVI01_12330 [Gemmatimonadales bacterium]
MRGHVKNGRRNGSRSRVLLNRVGGSSRPDRALPLNLRLQAIADNIPTEIIDELWVFPPLPDRDAACEFLVLVCYDGGEDRRRIVTAHVDAQRTESGGEDLEWVQRLREHGTAPHQWVAGMPERLLQRLSEAGIPEVIEVAGREDAWSGAIERFAQGDGNGQTNGNGNGGPQIKRAFSVDNEYVPAITFSTINETSVSRAEPQQEQ